MRRLSLVKAIALTGIAWTLNSPERAFALSGPPVLTGCVVEKTGIDCQGDLSKGIELLIPASGAGFQEFAVNIHDVTSTMPGVLIAYDDYLLKMLSDTGNQRIVASKSIGIGLEAAEILFKHEGDISAEMFGGVGIYAYANPPPPFLPGAKPPRELEGVIMQVNSDITVGPHGVGIFARGESAGVTVESLGDIHGAAGSRGIFALAHFAPFGEFGTGEVNVISRGDITLTNERSTETGDDPDIPEELTHMTGAIVAYNAGGGNVVVGSYGDIKTEGDKQNGILAISAGLAFGALNPVQILAEGDISTSGDDAYGIVAATSSAAVIIAARSDINTSGARSSGISVTSGNGAVVETYGDIAARGEDAFGINVDASAGAEVEVMSGTISGGTGNGAGVNFAGTAQNKLINHGTILGGGSGRAVYGMAEATDIVDNYGTIEGNIELVPPSTLGASADQIGKTKDLIRNRPGATLAPGLQIQTGPNGVVLNEGTLNPGGAGNIQRTNISGKLEQTATGSIGIDIDLRRSEHDHIILFPSINPADDFEDDFDGRPAATLAGRILPNLLVAPRAEGKQEFLIIDGEAGLEIKGLTVTSTPLTQYKLLYPDSETAVLEVSTRFSADGVSSNTSGLLSYLAANAGSDATGAYEAAVLAFLRSPDVAAIDQLGRQLNTSSGSGVTAALLSGMNFSNGLRSCPVAEGPYGQQRETSCIWATPGAREFSQSAGPDRAKINSNTTSLMGGVQTQLAQDVWAGLGFAIEDTSGTADQLSTFDGTTWQLGGVAKWATGPWKVSGSFSAGQSSTDTSRRTGLALSDTATSDTDVTLVSTSARFSYSFGASSFYLTPMVDVGATWVRMDGFEEQGAGLFKLAVASASEWIFSAGPAVEVGATVVSNGMTLRPFVKGGVTFLSDDNFAVQARLSSLSPATASFAVSSAFDDTFAALDAGLQLFSESGINLKLGYQGRFGEHSRDNGVDAKLTINY